MTKSLLEIALLSAYLLVLIFHQFPIIGLSFPQTLIEILKRFLKVNNANTKKYGINKSLLNKRFLRGVLVITTAQLHSTKPELRFCAGLNPARGVSEICDGEDL